VDLGKELISLGHAVSCEDEGIGLRGDWDESRSLQKMLVRCMDCVIQCIAGGSSNKRISVWIFTG